jgi:hypothetical protein
MKDKVFHDTVHGNIRIPESYCDNIIDTLLFQRLRRVEQSSVRSLYPCARHDRFIHSIGVFYIGSMVIEWLDNNLSNELREELAPCWNKVTESYKIACLLHDVGHSPFSHTFEHYYDINKPQLLGDKLCEVITDSEFKRDYQLMSEAKPHEKVSAYLLASEFGKAVEQLGGVADYGARMIIGCKSNRDNTIERQLVNCLIKALHGEVDADRLDYAVRDQWAAGFSSARIQTERLLRSILIVKDPATGKLQLCFTKNAINQIESLAQIKDFQNRWVFCHQNVKYDQHILSRAIETVASIYGNLEHLGKEETLSKIFNFDCFVNPDYKIQGQSLYLLSDDTILQMLRQSFNQNEYAKEWLSRQYKKQPIWKTAAEYEDIFKNNRVINNAKIEAKLDDMGLKKEQDYFVLEANCKHFTFLDGEVWIYVNNTLVDVNSIIPKSVDNAIKIFYVYLSKDKFDKKEAIIKQIQGIV